MMINNACRTPRILYYLAHPPWPAQESQPAACVDNWMKEPATPTAEVHDVCAVVGSSTVLLLFVDLSSTISPRVVA